MNTYKRHRFPPDIQVLWEVWQACRAAGGGIVTTHAAASAGDQATLIGYFVIIDGLLLLNFSLHGAGGLDYLGLGLVVLLPLICGSLLGAWLFPKASPKTYRNLALATVSAAAVISPAL